MKAVPVRLATTDNNFEFDLQARLHVSSQVDAAVDRIAADILADVKHRGDEAVLEYTNRFDRLSAPSVQSLELTQSELKRAFESISSEQRHALQSAAGRIRSYHERQNRSAARAGVTAMKTAACWAKKSHPLTAQAFMFPVARPPIHPVC